jgi:hypothetical protein
MNKTIVKAFSRVKQGKASKAELKVLLEWAYCELKQWGDFIGEIEKKLNEIK